MTESGLQAEAVTFFGPDDLDRFVHVKDSAQQLLYKKPAGKPMGVRETDGKYINRPETIEYVKPACSARLPTVADPVAAFGRSVFYMYRLTGDKSWQEKGWRMFTAWMDNSLVDNGIASIADVRRRSGVKIDNMERCAASPPPRARVQLLTPFPPFIIEPVLPWQKPSSTHTSCTQIRPCSVSTTTCSTPVSSTSCTFAPRSTG